MIAARKAAYINELPITNPKSVICPICSRGKIIIEDKDAGDAELYVVEPGSGKKAKWYVKCPACKRQVGFSIKLGKTK